MAPGLIMPKDLIPTSDPSSTAALAHRNGNVSAEEGYASAGSAGISEGVGLGAMAKGKTKAKAEGDGKSPVDKTFLLGFLEDVARRGR
jgi:mRNA-decapping enzyme subunit 2